MRLSKRDIGIGGYEIVEKYICQLYGNNQRDIIFLIQRFAVG
jgi:hypothetical protein